MVITEIKSNFNHILNSTACSIFEHKHKKLFINHKVIKNLTVTKALQEIADKGYSIKQIRWNFM